MVTSRGRNRAPWFSSHSNLWLYTWAPRRGGAIFHTFSCPTYMRLKPEESSGPAQRKDRKSSFHSKCLWTRRYRRETLYNTSLLLSIFRGSREGQTFTCADVRAIFCFNKKLINCLESFLCVYSNCLTLICDTWFGKRQRTANLEKVN